MDEFIDVEKKPISSFIKSQAYFLKLIFKEHPKMFLLFGFLTLFISIMPPLTIILHKEMIDNISIVNGDPKVLKISIILLGIFFLMQFLQDVFDLVNRYIFSKISYAINFVLKKLLINKFIKIPLKEYEDSAFYDTINLSNTAIEGNGVRVVEDLIRVIGYLISGIGIFGTLLSIHWSLPIALLLSTLPGIVLLFIAKQKGFDMQKDVSAKERELGFTDGLFINRSVLKEIKLFNTGDFLKGKWSRLFLHVRDKKLNIEKWECKTQSFANSILQFSGLGVAVFLVFQMYGGQLTIGSYVALLTAVTAVQGLFGSMAESLANIFETAVYNNALFQVLNYKVSSKENGDNQDLNDIQEICLENATFCYPNTDIEVVKNINLTIKKGDRLSIVGANGSGKTTLVNCLLGLYDLSSGNIRVNGMNIEKVNKEDYYKNISAIFQNFTQYKYSLRENVGFYSAISEGKDQEIMNALKKVDLDKKVLNFRDGLGTYLAKEMPNGSELSGGEWQRVALARAFYKDANFIVLDEPTAALDPITELEFFNMFHNLSHDKTSITISHRIGPTKLSDRIIVLDQGRIVEDGSFEYLMSIKGLYYEMYKAQSKWYEFTDEVAIVR